MRSTKTSFASLVIVGGLVMVGPLLSGCSAEDTISVANKPKAGSGGSSGTSSSGAAGMMVGSGSGGGGASVTSGAGGMIVGAGGNPNTSAGGAAGTVDTTPDAAGGAGGSGGTSVMDAATEMAPVVTCANPTMCIKAALVHRYSFNGTGTSAMDTVGTSHGTVMNGMLSGNGDVVLGTGTPAVYVDLPNGIISSLTNATVEAWVNWSGGNGWQRLFDFGNSDAGVENVTGSASTTFYLTPQAGGPTAMLAAYKRSDQTYAMETRAVSQLNTGLATATVSHVAVVVDQAHMLMTLYRNGMPDGSVLFTDSLGMLQDINNWIGRSQYTSDPPFAGTLTEFRIYNAALAPDVIQASYTAGPNATF
jgi:hypothetical protein